MATRSLVLLILAAIAVFGLASCTVDNAISSHDTLYTGQYLAKLEVEGQGPSHRPKAKAKAMASRSLVLLILAAIAVFSLKSCNDDNAIGSHDTLYAGQYLATGNYQFIMQSDCNLVLYDFGKPIWASNTGTCQRLHAIIQEDENLVIYNNRGRPVWASNAGGLIVNYVLVLQKDGNVVIYGPAIWATNTHTAAVGVTIVQQNFTNSTAAAVEQVIVSVA